MKKLNQNGMTLIEVVMAMLILAVTGIIMTIGFTTAFRNFNEANDYKDLSDYGQALLAEGNVDSDDFQGKQKNTNITIKRGSYSKNIDVSAKYLVGNEFKGLKLYNFEAIEKANIEQVSTDVSTQSVSKVVYDNYVSMIKEIYTAIGSPTNAYITSNTATIKTQVLTWANSKGITNTQMTAVSFTGDIWNRSQINKLYNLVYGDYDSFRYDSTDTTGYIYPFIYLLKDNTPVNLFTSPETSLLIITSTQKTNSPMPDYAKYMYNTLTDTWYYRKGSNLSTNPSASVSIDKYNDNDQATWYTALDVTSVNWTKLS